MEASYEFEEKFSEIRQARALYAFSGNEDDELSVQKGEIIHLLGKAEEDWSVLGVMPAAQY